MLVHAYLLSHPEVPMFGLSLESVGTRSQSRRLQCWALGLDLWTPSYRHQLTPHCISCLHIPRFLQISRGRRVRRLTINMSHNVRYFLKFLHVTEVVHCSSCTFSLNVLCFPFTIGKVKITVFHLLVACTFVFTYLWGYVIYNTLIKDNQVIRLIALKIID